MINITISTNVLIIISCIALVAIIATIIYIIYKDKKLDQEEIDDLIDDIVNAKPRDELDVKPKKIPLIEEEKKIKESDNLDLEEMLNHMQKNLDKKEERKIESFEKDQEENAIISYRELKKVANKVDNYEKEQEENAIISYNELSKKNHLDALEEKEEFFKPKKKISKIESPRDSKDKKFKNTDFISPIYGKMNEHIEYPKIKAIDKNDDLTLNEYFGEDVDNYYHEGKKDAIDIKPLKKEIEKNDEFLKALKEFRNNL